MKNTNMSLFYAALLTFSLTACGRISTPQPDNAPTPPPTMHVPTIPDDYTQYKPSGGVSAQQARTMCKMLSDVAASKQTRTLVIAFEGLASFDGTGTRNAYDYMWNISHNRPAAYPRGGGAGYLLNQLIVPLVAKYGAQIEFLMFPETSQSGSSGSNAQICAEEWMKVGGRKLAVSGHSYGGHAANQLVSALDRDGRVPVDYVFTVDARTRMYVGTLARPSNVAYWENFYQKNTIFLTGYQVGGADLNLNLSSTGLGHTSIPRSPVIFEHVTKVLNP
jgi:predicted small lipoprotein YifL